MCGELKKSRALTSRVYRSTDYRQTKEEKARGRAASDDDSRPKNLVQPKKGGHQWL
jgi:hypothetical protein